MDIDIYVLQQRNESQKEQTSFVPNKQRRRHTKAKQKMKKIKREKRLIIPEERGKKSFEEYERNEQRRVG